MDGGGALRDGLGGGWFLYIHVHCTLYNLELFVWRKRYRHGPKSTEENLW